MHQRSSFDLSHGFRRLMTWGVLAGLAAGVVAGALQKYPEGYFQLLLALGVFALETGLSLRLMVIVWRLPFFRALLLLLLGLPALWLSALAGWQLGKGNLDGDLHMGYFTGWILSSLIGSVALAYPHRRLPGTEPEAALGPFLRFRLRSLMIVVTLTAILLGVGCLPRGTRWIGRNTGCDRGRTADFYKSVGQSCEAHFLSEGFERISRPPIPQEIGLRGPQTKESWFQKDLANNVHLYGSVSWNGAGVLVILEAQVPERSIPFSSPQEREADRIINDLRQICRRGG